MPTRKLRLSRTEEADTLACLRQLQAEGIDIEIPDEWEERSSCPLKITPGRDLGMICDLPGGHAGYAIPFRMVAQSRLTLVDYDLACEWDDQIELTAHLEERDGRCKFGHFDYLATEVLNDRLDKPLAFHYRGQLVEGVILAYGLESIPEEYRRRGGIVPVRLTFIDTLEREVRAEVKLLVERSAKRQKAVVCPSNGLFDPAKTPEVSEVVVREGPSVPPVPDLDVNFQNLARGEEESG